MVPWLHWPLPRRSVGKTFFRRTFGSFAQLFSLVEPQAWLVAQRRMELPPCWISSGPDHCPQPRVDIPLRNKLYSALRRLPSEQRALVMDVGANDGLFSLNLMHLAERVPPTGVAPLPAYRRATQPPDSLARRISLVLVEPQRSVSHSLQRLAARYGGSEHWPVAAWTRDANLTLHADRNSVRSSLLFAPDTGRHRSDEYTVPAIDLASHLHREVDRRRPALLLLKIDVEVCLVARSLQPTHAP